MAGGVGTGVSIEARPLTEKQGKTLHQIAAQGPSGSIGILGPDHKLGAVAGGEDDDFFNCLAAGKSLHCLGETGRGQRKLFPNLNRGGAVVDADHEQSFLIRRHGPSLPLGGCQEALCVPLLGKPYGTPASGTPTACPSLIFNALLKSGAGGG